MEPVPLLAAAAAAAALADWAAVAGRLPAPIAVERIAKPAVLVALVAIAVVAPADPSAWPGSVRPLVVAALLLGLAGDLLLLPGGRFAAGIGAFLLGHVAYGAAFAAAPPALPLVAAGAAGALVVGQVVGPRILAGAWSAGLGRPVALYLVVILATAVLATGTGRAALALGAWCFVASDALVGLQRFGRGAETRDPTDDRVRGPRDRRVGVAIMTTYHAAQALLLAGLLA